MKARGRVALAILVAAALAGCGGGHKTQPAPTASTAAPVQRGGVKLEQVGTFDAPVYVAQPPGDGSDLFVVEQGGKIKVIHNGQVQAQPFLDLSGQVTSGGEQGLLSMAFAPDYSASGRFYVDYTDSSGNTQVVEYRQSAGSPLTADSSRKRNILTVDQPFSNHNGGLLMFGPDHLLYIGTGDGGSEGDPQRNGQSLGTLLGKLLRIDPTPSGSSPYTVPADNPFKGQSGAKPEIYAYGLRNPWRFSFDSNRAIAIGDVGQNKIEEVDYVDLKQLRGANFGWSAFEGNEPLNKDRPADDAIPPVFTYTHSQQRCSITGGYVVHDPDLPAVRGRYVYGDYCSGGLASIVPSAGNARDNRPLGLNVPSLSSFGQDNAGHVYAVSLDGPVYRLAPK